MSLSQAPIAKLCRISRVETGNPHSYRLMEMGLIEGAQVQIVRRAPFGDPLHVRLGDYELSLRSSEAELIEVDAL